MACIQAGILFRRGQAAPELADAEWEDRMFNLVKYDGTGLPQPLMLVLQSTCPARHGAY